MTELVNAGRSIIEMLWDRLDSLVDDIMTDEEFEDSDDKLRGRAQGMAEAIAIWQNPYAPNVPGIQTEAMERWEIRNQEE